VEKSVSPIPKAQSEQNIIEINYKPVPKLSEMDAHDLEVVQQENRATYTTFLELIALYKEYKANLKKKSDEEKKESVKAGRRGFLHFLRDLFRRKNKSRTKGDRLNFAQAEEVVLSKEFKRFIEIIETLENNLNAFTENMEVIKNPNKEIENVDIIEKQKKDVSRKKLEEILDRHNECVNKMLEESKENNLDLSFLDSIDSADIEKDL